MDPNLEQACPKCHFLMSDKFYFCPNCGFKIKEPPLATTFAKQLNVYLISAFLPPFGIVPAMRYLRQPDTSRRMIGWAALIITIVSTLLTGWFAYTTFSQASLEMNKQLQGMQGGY